VVNLELKDALAEHDHASDVRERLDEQMADVLGAVNEHNEIAAYTRQTEKLTEMLAMSQARRKKKGWFR
jgi:hypothetical protein